MSEESSGADPSDPPRETTPGRGPGEGEWLETRLAAALETWGYVTAQRERLLALTADVVARRETFQDEPADFLVCECKDWATRPVSEETIIRLCLLAFVGRAMPVLCHTTHLTERAWKLAQAYDVRLLTLDDLQKDRLPPLTRHRPPEGTYVHQQSQRAEEFRSTLPAPLWRTTGDLATMNAGDKTLPEAPVFGTPEGPPCYVTDRTGHEEYVNANRCDYDFRKTHPWEGD